MRATIRTLTTHLSSKLTRTSDDTGICTTTIQVCASWKPVTRLLTSATPRRHARNICMVLDEYDEDLKHFVKNRCCLPVPLRRYIVYQIMSAVAHIHGLDIIHRDIKTENILIRRSDLAIVMADFGLAKVMRPSTTATEPLEHCRGRHSALEDPSFCWETATTASWIWYIHVRRLQHAHTLPHPPYVSARACRLSSIDAMCHRRSGRLMCD